MVRVKEVRVYPNFEAMLNAEPWQKIVPQVQSQDRALTLLREIYGPSKEALGVHVLEVEKV